jgi:hypothetical protein
VVDQGRREDAEDDRDGLAELGSEDEGQELGLVAYFSQGDDAGRDQEGFQLGAPRPARRRSTMRLSGPVEAAWSMVLPGGKPACTMT